MPYPQYNNPNDRMYIGSPEDRLLLEAYSRPEAGVNVTAFQPLPQGLLTGTIGTSQNNPKYAEANYYNNGYNVKAGIDDYVKQLSIGNQNHTVGAEFTNAGNTPYYQYNDPNLQARISGGKNWNANASYQTPALSGLLGVEGNVSPQDQRLGINWKKEF